MLRYYRCVNVTNVDIVQKNEIFLLLLIISIYFVFLFIITSHFENKYELEKMLSFSLPIVFLILSLINSVVGDACYYYGRSYYCAGELNINFNVFFY